MDAKLESEQIIFEKVVFHHGSSRREPALATTGGE